MIKPYQILLIVGMPLAIGVMFWRFGKGIEREAESISTLETMPLPSLTGAYTKLIYLLSGAIPTGFFGVMSTSQAISSYSSDKPELLVLLAPIAIAADVILLCFMYKIVMETKFSPWGHLIIQLTTDEIKYKNRWAVKWTQINEIHFLAKAGYKTSTAFMILKVNDIERIPKKYWGSSSDTAYFKKVGGVNDPFLAIEIDSTTLPIWKYQILVNRYWCSSRNQSYIPAKHAWPYQLPYSITEEKTLGGFNSEVQLL